MDPFRRWIAKIVDGVGILEVRQKRRKVGFRFEQHLPLTPRGQVGFKTCRETIVGVIINAGRASNCHHAERKNDDASERHRNSGMKQPPPHARAPTTADRVELRCPEIESGVADFRGRRDSRGGERLGPRRGRPFCPPSAEETNDAVRRSNTLTTYEGWQFPTGRRQVRPHRQGRGRPIRSGRRAGRRAPPLRPTNSARQIRAVGVGVREQADNRPRAAGPQCSYFTAIQSRSGCPVPDASSNPERRPSGRVQAVGGIRHRTAGEDLFCRRGS